MQHDLVMSPSKHQRHVHKSAFYFKYHMSHAQANKCKKNSFSFIKSRSSFANLLQHDFIFHISSLKFALQSRLLQQCTRYLSFLLHGALTIKTFFTYFHATVNLTRFNVEACWSVNFSPKKKMLRFFKNLRNNNGLYFGCWFISG